MKTEVYQQPRVEILEILTEQAILSVSNSPSWDFGEEFGFDDDWDFDTDFNRW